jgi:hypothetical protein
MAILTVGHMVCFLIDMGIWYFATKAVVIKECNAPKSNKTIAGCELIKNIPSAMS